MSGEGFAYFRMLCLYEAEDAPVMRRLWLHMNGDYILDVPYAKLDPAPCERDALALGGRYFLAAFLGGFADFFGVNGCGGVCSMRRSTSSVRRWSASSGLGFSFMAGV